MSQTSRHPFRPGLRGLSLFVATILVTLPLATALFWLDPESYRALNPHALVFSLPTPAPLPGWQKAAGFLVNMIAVGLLMVALHHLRALLALWRTGQRLSAASARRCRLTGLFTIGYGIADIASEPLLSLALTLGNPVGERMIVLGLEATQILAFLPGVMALAMSHVITEGADTRTELDAII
ncbi:DUF2975 domain-containing protein [Yunchengibacter salinarum]|uniref:DUF2975 domain-containing protein n=1 Tax=Yunchengibacter salinarum TaxID=3133399 RepID=UPI0035B585FE